MAKVVLARKLEVVLHRMLHGQTSFVAHKATQSRRLDQEGTTHSSGGSLTVSPPRPSLFAGTMDPVRPFSAQQHR